MLTCILELAAVVIYLIGYLIVALLAFCHNEPCFWAYTLIALAATCHALVTIGRMVCGRR